ncbi:hypothetical protein [Bradyrhizobium liaoningense]
MAWLENDGMGVCGYTYREVQDMPIDALSRAITAKNKHDAAPWNALFRMFCGDPEPEQPKVSARPFSIDLFDAWFPG